GTIALSTAAMDIGGLRAAEAQVMAEVLGIPYADVHPRYVDTDGIGFSGMTGGSGTASGVSSSVFHVANQIKDRMIERAAKIWEVDKAQVNYGDDAVLTGPATEDGKERTFSFKQLASVQAGTGGYI